MSPPPRSIGEENNEAEGRKSVADTCRNMGLSAAVEDSQCGMTAAAEVMPYVRKTVEANRSINHKAAADMKTFGTDLGIRTHRMSTHAMDGG